MNPHTFSWPMKLHIELTHPIIHHLHFIVTHHPANTKKRNHVTAAIRMNSANLQFFSFWTELPCSRGLWQCDNKTLTKRRMRVTISSWDSNTNEACRITLTLELRVYQHLQSEGKLKVSPRTKGRRKTRGKSHNFMTSISRRLLGDDMAVITARTRRNRWHTTTLSLPRVSSSYFHLMMSFLFLCLCYQK